MWCRPLWGNHTLPEVPRDPMDQQYRVMCNFQMWDIYLDSVPTQFSLSGEILERELWLIGQLDDFCIVTGVSVFSHSSSQRLIERQCHYWQRSHLPKQTDGGTLCRKRCCERDNWGDNWKTSLDKSEVSLPKLPIVQIALEIVKSKSDPIRILSKSKSGNQHRATQATQAINTKQHHGNFQYWSFTDIALNTRRTNNNTCGSCPAMSSSLKTHLTKTVTF